MRKTLVHSITYSSINNQRAFLSCKNHFVFQAGVRGWPWTQGSGWWGERIPWPCYRCSQYRQTTIRTRQGLFSDLQKTRIGTEGISVFCCFYALWLAWKNVIIKFCVMIDVGLVDQPIVAKTLIEIFSDCEHLQTLYHGSPHWALLIHTSFGDLDFSYT